MQKEINSRAQIKGSNDGVWCDGRDVQTNKSLFYVVLARFKFEILHAERAPF
jgi:hypothetical protein